MLCGNRAEITGEILTTPYISHVYQGQTFYAIMIKSRCFSNNNAKFYYTRVCISENILEICPLSPGDFVTVKGSLLNSRHKEKTTLSVLADEVYPSFPENAKYPYNYIEIIGRITKIFTNEANFEKFINFIITSFDVETGKRILTARITAWGKLARHLLNSLRTGDKVKIAGSLSNSAYGSDSILDRDAVIFSEVYCTSCIKSKHGKFGRRRLDRSRNNPDNSGVKEKQEKQDFQKPKGKEKSF